MKTKGRRQSTNIQDMRVFDPMLLTQMGINENNKDYTGFPRQRTTYLGPYLGSPVPIADRPPPDSEGWNRLTFDQNGNPQFHYDNPVTSEEAYRNLWLLQDTAQPQYLQQEQPDFSSIPGYRKGGAVMHPMKKKTDAIAKHGRFGDDALLHVSREELKGLASLAPSGKLPHNPKTGLPEAFFFLPFLAAAAAPAAAATTAAAAVPAALAAAAPAAAGLGAAAGGAGLTAAGLGAGTAAAALPTAAEAAGAGLAAAAPAAAAAAPETAAALAPAAAGGVDAAANTIQLVGPAAAQGAAGGAASGAGGIASLGAPNPLVGAGGISSAPASIAPGPTSASLAASPVAGPLAPTSSSSALASPASAVSNPLGAGAATPLTSGTSMASATGAKGGIGGLLGKLGNIDMMKLAPLAMMMPRGGGGGGGDDEDKHKKKVSGDYQGSGPVFPGSSYRGGIDPEWNYFPHYATGGIVGLGGPSVLNQSPAMVQAMPQAQGGIMNSNMGVTAPMGGGGIAQLMQPPAMEPQAPPAQLDSPYARPSGQPKGKEGGKNDQELIAATVEALQGRSPNPQAVITAFVQTFGQKALQDLATRIQQTSSPARSPMEAMGGGDGQSDSVPGLIDGSQPAALSSGEYIVPSDVVSHLGNGSTNAGAQQLDDMVGRTRMARGGMVGHPPSINPRSMMPS